MCKGCEGANVLRCSRKRGRLSSFCPPCRYQREVAKSEGEKKLKAEMAAAQAVHSTRSRSSSTQAVRAVVEVGRGEGGVVVWMGCGLSEREKGQGVVPGEEKGVKEIGVRI